VVNPFLYLFGLGRDAAELDQFEPIHGLPQRSLDEWLANNSQLKKKYEVELSARLLRDRVVRGTRSQPRSWKPWKCLVQAASTLRLVVRRALSMACAALADNIAFFQHSGTTGVRSAP
jgi:hypothetical protein